MISEGVMVRDAATRGDVVQDGLWNDVHALEYSEKLYDSAHKGWRNVYVSAQIEEPGKIELEPIPHLFVGLVRAGVSNASYRTADMGGSVILRGGLLGLVAPHQALSFGLGKRLHTTHLYLNGSFVRRVVGEIYDGIPTALNIRSKVGFDDPLLEELVNAIAEAAEMNLPVSERYIDQLAKAAICEIARRHSNAPYLPSRSSRPEQLGRKEFAAFLDLIESKMDQKITLAQMAEGSGLTPGHFARVFKASTGGTPYQYLLNARVQRARHLLTSTTLPIMQIALQCGFADHVHFTRVFSRTTGQSPAAFRKASSMTAGPGVDMANGSSRFSPGRASEKPEMDSGYLPSV